MSPPHPLPAKKDVALALLERASVYVHLDPRQDGVVVPENFRKQAQLVLQIGHQMIVRIPDLRLDDDGMSCTLSFNREPFYCVVPWGSVFAMIGDDGVQGMVWPDDVPLEVSRNARAIEGTVQKELQGPVVAREPKAEGPKPKRPRKRPVLAAVADSSGQDGATKPVKVVRPVDERLVRPSQGSPARPAAAPAQPSRIGGGARKKRKELPPYLRVVK